LGWASLGCVGLVCELALISKVGLVEINLGFVWLILVGFISVGLCYAGLVWLG
jgi:hypothetical protein